MLKLQVGDLASAEQLQLPLCTVCNSGRPIGGPHATQCVICRQSRRRGNKNARGSIGNRGNHNARGDAQQRRITCAKCNKEKEERFFPKQALRNEKRALGRKTGLVCNACRGSKLCKTCCKWKETSEFRDGQEVCKGCQEIYCCGCGLSKAPGMFSVKDREHISDNHLGKLHVRSVLRKVSMQGLLAFAKTRSAANARRN